MEAITRSRGVEGGVLPGPGRSLNGRQQRTPGKVLRHSPPPDWKGAASSPRRRLHGRSFRVSTSRRLLENLPLPSTNQQDQPPYLPPFPYSSAPFLTPAIPERFGLVAFLGGGCPGRSRSRCPHPEASAGPPAPTSGARFLPRCAGARS